MNGMNRPRMSNLQSSTVTLTLHTPVLPRLPKSIRQLVNAAYAAHGGAERMRLGEWLAVEEELKQRLKNEYHEHQR
jgi:hypothetical protein